LKRKEAKTLGVLTIATITINDGMKWRSKPAPGAPLGQFDAQNLPNLIKIDVSIKVGRLDVPLFGTVGREVFSEEILTATRPPSQVLGSLGIERR